MKRSLFSAERGNILMVALIVVAIVSGFVAVAFNATNGAARLTDRSRDYAATSAAAEGAVEYAFGIWKKRISVANRALTTAEASASLTGPSYPGLSYAPSAELGPLAIDALDEYGAPVTTPTPVVIDL